MRERDREKEREREKAIMNNNFRISMQIYLFLRNFISCFLYTTKRSFSVTDSLEFNLPCDVIYTKQKSENATHNLAQKKLLFLIFRNNMKSHLKMLFFGFHLLQTHVQHYS